MADRPNTLTPRKLRQLIAKGETETVEFKGRGASLQDITSAVVCFANGEGGLIVWGVEEDGSIRGVNLRRLQAVPKHVYHSTSPSQLVHAEAVTVDGMTVITVGVTHSLVLVSTTGGAYLQRLGTECVPMTPDRLIVRQIDTRTLDLSNAITPIPPTQISERELERYRSLLPADETGDALRAMQVLDFLQAIGAVDSSAPDQLTAAGLLLFGNADVIRSVLPQHQVHYLRTPAGTTEYERRVSSSAPVLEMVEQVVREIQAASRVRQLRLGLRDLEVPDYPERVLREAIVNALAHRHYMLPGDTVIRQTSGFLEIESPGGFPEGISADTVIQHAPVHRNRLLCNLLDRVRYMERSGLGVDRIFEDQLRFGKSPPTYEADRTKVRLRLDASEFDEAFARYVLTEEESGRVWRVEDLLIASHLRRMGPTDRATLAAVIQRTEDEAQEVMAGLLGTVIARFGTGPGTRFALAARTQAALGAEGTFTRERGLARATQRELVIQHAKDFGRVDNRTVREILQVNPGQASNLLRALEAEGQIVQRNRKRWAYYVPAQTAPG